MEPQVNFDDRKAGWQPSLQPCHYRRAVHAAPGMSGYYVCNCAGGIPIGLVEAEEPQVAEICGRCKIPSEIDPARNRRSCLFLIPVRILENAGLRTGFSCRWFYNLKPKRLPKEAWLCCLGCNHWFPRPTDEEMIPRMIDWIHKVIRLYWEEETRSGFWDSRVSREDPIRTSNSLLSEWLSFRINRFRELLRMRRERRVSQIARAEE